MSSNPNSLQYLFRCYKVFKQVLTLPQFSRSGSKKEETAEKKIAAIQKLKAFTPARFADLVKNTYNEVKKRFQIDDGENSESSADTSGSSSTDTSINQARMSSLPTPGLISFVMDLQDLLIQRFGDDFEKMEAEEIEKKENDKKTMDEAIDAGNGGETLENGEIEPQDEGTMGEKYNDEQPIEGEEEVRASQLQGDKNATVFENEEATEEPSDRDTLTLAEASIGDGKAAKSGKDTSAKSSKDMKESTEVKKENNPRPDSAKNTTMAGPSVNSVGKTLGNDSIGESLMSTSVTSSSISSAKGKTMGKSTMDTATMQSHGKETMSSSWSSDGQTLRESDPGKPSSVNATNASLGKNSVKMEAFKVEAKKGDDTEKLKVQISALEARMEEKQEELRKKEEEFKQDLGKFQAQLQATEKKASTQAAQVTAMQAESEKAAKLKKDYAALTQEVESLRKQRKSSAATKEEAEKLRKSYEANKTELDTAKQELKKVKQDLDSTRKKLQEDEEQHENARNEMQQQIATAQQRADTVASELAASKEELNALRSSVQHSDETVKQEISILQQTVEVNNHEIDRLKKQIRDLTSEKESAMKETKRLASVVKMLADNATSGTPVTQNISSDMSSYSDQISFAIPLTSREPTGRLEKAKVEAFIERMEIFVKAMQTLDKVSSRTELAVSAVRDVGSVVSQDAEAFVKAQEKTMSESDAAAAKALCEGIESDLKTLDEGTQKIVKLSKDVLNQLDKTGINLSSGLLKLVKIRENVFSSPAQRVLTAPLKGSSVPKQLSSSAIAPSESSSTKPTKDKETSMSSPKPSRKQTHDNKREESEMKPKPEKEKAERPERPERPEKADKDTAAATVQNSPKISKERSEPATLNSPKPSKKVNPDSRKEDLDLANASKNGKGESGPTQREREVAKQQQTEEKTPIEKVDKKHPAKEPKERDPAPAPTANTATSSAPAAQQGNASKTLSFQDKFKIERDKILKIIQALQPYFFPQSNAKNKEQAPDSQSSVKIKALDQKFEQALNLLSTQLQGLDSFVTSEVTKGPYSDDVKRPAMRKIYDMTNAHSKFQSLVANKKNGSNDFAGVTLSDADIAQWKAAMSEIVSSMQQLQATLFK